MAKIELLRPERVAQADVDDINELLRQLTANPESLTHGSVIWLAKNSNWFIFRDEAGRIKGMGTLNSAPAPCGNIVHLADFVVHDSMRGLGVADGLYHNMMNWAQNKLGADRVNFTCKPERVAANKFYMRMGAIQRPTNSYLVEF